MKIGILGIGSYLPERILTNKEMESIVDTTDEWITSRTGIRERRIAADDEATSDLSYKAALKAIEDAGIDKDEIELVIVATTTPDYSIPVIFRRRFFSNAVGDNCFRNFSQRMLS